MHLRQTREPKKSVGHPQDSESSCIHRVTSCWGLLCTRKLLCLPLWLAALYLSYPYGFWRSKRSCMDGECQLDARGTLYYSKTTRKLHLAAVTTCHPSFLAACAYWTAKLEIKSHYWSRASDSRLWMILYQDLGRPRNAIFWVYRELLCSESWDTQEELKMPPYRPELIKTAAIKDKTAKAGRKKMEGLTR